MNELGGLGIGFMFGIAFGALFFELFSVKHPKTREEAEQLLALLPPVVEAKEYEVAVIEGWKTNA